MSTTAVSDAWRTSRLGWLFQSVSDRGHEDEMVLSVYRDHGVIPKDSRNDNFNRTPENLSNYQLVQPGDLVVNRMKAWQGSLGVSEHRGIVSPDYEVLRPTLPEYDHRFLHSLLRSRGLIDQYALRSTGIRPSQWRLYWDEMKTIEISLPTAAQQRTIADYLDRETTRIDTLIEEQKRFIEMLDERRNAVIAETTTKGMSPTRALVKSGPGPLWVALPDGWRVGQVKNAATVTLGKMLQSKDSGSDVQAPYMRAANVQPDGVLALDDVNEMWFSDAELEQLSIRAGDVVVVEGGQGGFGRAAYVGEDLSGWGFQNSINRLRPIDGFDGRFLAFYLIALRASGFIRAYSNVVSMPHLTAEKLARIPMPLPPLEEQRAIADYLDRETTRIDTLIAETERFIDLARERRAALITAAVTGQIDVREVA